MMASLCALGICGAQTSSPDLPARYSYVRIRLDSEQDMQRLQAGESSAVKKLVLLR